MKGRLKILRFGVLAGICFLFLSVFSSCYKEDDIQPVRQNVVFGFEDSDEKIEDTTTELSRTLQRETILKDDDISPDKVIVSVEKYESGSWQETLTAHEVKLLSFGDDYISSPLSLIAGKEYRITLFEVAYYCEEEEENIILYKAPEEGSEGENYVNDGGVPREFNLSKDEKENLDFQVIRV